MYLPIRQTNEPVCRSIIAITLAFRLLIMMLSGAKRRSPACFDMKR